MPSRKFSLMIIDEDRETRESLRDLFCALDYEVFQADSAERALGILADGTEQTWPSVIVAGAKAESFLGRLRAEVPRVLDVASLVVFPSFRMTIPAQAGRPAKLTSACRLSSVSNLLALVQGLARKRLASLEAG